MKEKISALVAESIQPLGLVVSDVKTVDQEGVMALEIELDSQDVIDLNTVTKATEIINPILDAAGIIGEEIDVVDIYGKSKEEVEK